MIVPQWLAASPRPSYQPLFIITERIQTKHPELIFLCHLRCLQHIVVGFVFAFLISLISVCYVFGIKLVATALYLKLRFPHDVTGIIVAHLLGISVVIFFFFYNRNKRRQFHLNVNIVARQSTCIIQRIFLLFISERFGR